MEYQKPDYSFNFDDDKSGAAKSGADASINQLTQQVFNAMNPAPLIDDLPDTFVQLPAGLVRDDEIINTAEVRELTGEDEELLAKARTSNNATKFVSVLLKQGVISIGDIPAGPEVFDELLQGDIDALLLGIRRATFGDSFEIFNVTCSNCGDLNDITLNLVDIPVKNLDDPEERIFTVKLRKGRSAKLQFPTGAVQNEIFKKQFTLVEMNNITLTYCVLSFIEADGTEYPSSGMSDIKKLGVADRKILQNYIFDNQPGPRYDQVTAKCSNCEGEVLVPLNVGILFREL